MKIFAFHCTIYAQYRQYKPGMDRIKHDVFCRFRKRMRMKYHCAHLLVIALGVCRVSGGREGRVIFMNTDSNIDIGKYKRLRFPL
jgi:hypothetical protein